MDSISNSIEDLKASSDSFITQVYKEIAKKVWKSHLIKASIEDDYKGIDYYLFNYSVQFKELKSGPDRGCFDLEAFPFETAAKNKYGNWSGGWVSHTEADYLVFIRTIRSTGEWRAFVFDWSKLKLFIVENTEKSYINRFGSAKNCMIKKERIKDFLVAELNNNSSS
jgi:hypothetical protein